MPETTQPVPATTGAPSADSEQLSLGTNLAFGAQGLFSAAMSLVIAVFLTKFYTDVVLMPAGILAIAIAAARAGDAIIDPIIGYLCDRTRSRWGRRKPWIFVGIFGSAIFYYMMLTPPRGLSGSGVMWWFTGALVLRYIFFGVYSVPRQALGVEVTLDAGQRQKLYGLAAALVAMGTILGGLTPTILQRTGVHDPRDQMQITAIIHVTGFVVVSLVFLAFVRERQTFAGRGEVPFVPGVRRALRSRPFRILFISNVITWIPFVIPAVLMPFFVQYVLQLGVLRWTGLYVITYLVSGFLALPAWIWAASKFGKLSVFRIVSVISVIGGAAMFFVGPGDEWLVFAIQVFVGTQSAVWYFLGASMNADVVDYDELHTGKRREAQFSAMFSVIPKLAMIPGAAVPLALLGLVGYVPNAGQQSSSVLLTLRVLFAIVPAVFNTVGSLVMWWYPLSERNHALIREGVAQHARGADALDPITKRVLPPPNRRSVDEATGWFLDSFSRRELRALGERGRRPLVSVILWAAAFATLVVSVTWFGMTHVGSFSRDPGPLPALAIVVAGLGLAGMVFHLLRVRPALQLSRETPPKEIVLRHLDAIDSA